MKSFTDAQGPGASSLEVADREGCVVLQFPNPVQWAALDPATAVQIAHAMVDAAKRCGWAETIILLPTRH
jgi:hypothetical protein